MDKCTTHTKKRNYTRNEIEPLRIPVIEAFMDAILHRLLCAAVLLPTFLAPTANADDVWPNGTAESTSVEAEYDKRIRAAEAIGGLGQDLFGDSVNLYSGALSFAATDVSVPGNFDLPVSIGRRFTVGGLTSSFSHFGDWELDVPHLSGVFAQLSDNSWINTGSGTERFNRCSRFEAPPTAAGSTGNGGFFEPYEFWHGVYLSTPGGREEVLLRDTSLSWQPTDGNAYPLVTTGRWMIRCLPTTASGEPGEAFLAVSPDGTQYRFDWMVSFLVPLVVKNHSVNPVPPEGGGVSGSSGPYSLTRREYWMLPTTITDRHGNTVTYTYDTAAGADRRRLLSISASDGRTISLSYVGTSNRIHSVTTGSRTWTYVYDVADHLHEVVLPDNSKWTLGVQNLRMPWMQYASNTPTCTQASGAGSYTPGTFVGTTVYTGNITHPSGAIGHFTVQATHHGRAFMPARTGNCVLYTPGAPGTTAGYERDPEVFDAWSLTTKTIEGPGLATLTWNYAYAPLQHSAVGDTCGTNCARTKTVTVTEPEGHVTTHTFGTAFQADEGQLLRTDITDAQSASVLRTTTYRYRSPTGNPYPAVVGQSLQETGDVYFSTHLLPEDRRQISQDGVTFTREATLFDAYAAPRAVTRSSSLGYSRTETTGYRHDTTRWVIGQIETVTESSTGAVVRQNTYDPLTANLTSTRAFGRPASTMTYHGDGTLWTLTDGANRTTTFADYQRGIAQSVTLADQSVYGALVNTYGEIDTLTRPGGHTTRYEYDAMGRLSLIRPPTNDVQSWNETTLHFAFMGVPEPGVPFGIWKQTKTTGTAATGIATTEVYFDALWRPVLTRTSDSANATATRRMTQTKYNSRGQAIAVAYAARDLGYATSVPGTRTRYDALGRVRDIDADLEGGGTAHTDIDYQTGFQRQITDPRLNTTTTTFQVFDEPDESAPQTITAPLTATTTFTRDVFGKPLTLTRSGVYLGASVSATRRYVYDANQRLCKTVEPESGATILAYDTAGLVQWKAAGQSFTGTTGCDQASVAANQKISYDYDPVHRLTTTSYGDASPSVIRHYTADGLLDTLQADDSLWTMTYNRRRLATAQTLTLAGQTYPIGYTYTANGDVASLRYPDNAVVDYAPNALGEATHVGTYATAISTHPNGALAGFTYGNGIVHATEQNLRGLPSRSRDGSVLDDSYSYDENGNVSGIVDNLGDIFTRSMGYDALDRLTSVTNTPVWGGTQTYDYDPLDNLRRSRAQGLDWTNQYNATNQRLDRIVHTANNSDLIVYGYDARGRATNRTVGPTAQTLTIDLADRVRSVNPNVASHRYDGYGRRTSVTKNGVTAVQIYSLAGQLLYQQAPTNDGIFRSGFQSSDTPYLTTSGGTRRYIYLGRHLVAEDGSNGRLYHHTDALGSPTRTTNAAGTASTRNLYQPYGWGTVPTSTPGFTGHVADAETGLSYMQARYYDPYAGRFLSVDPVMAGAGSFNRYWYGNDNPYRFVDPDGRQSRDVEWEFRQSGADRNRQDGGNLFLWMLVEVLSGFDDLNYRPPPGSGEVRPAVAPWEIFTPSRTILRSFGLRAGARAATTEAAEVVPNTIDGLASEASLPLGSKRLQMNQPKNPAYQPVRNEPTTISGRNYSGHAIDRMQDRGIMPSVVQNTIDTGAASSSRLGTTVYYDQINNVSVVVNAEGKVVTVKYGQ
jgi:RHS repeat-associated protein